MKKRIGVTELSKLVKEKVKENTVEEIIKATFNVIEESCAEDTAITIKEFGTFEKNHVKERAGRNPKTGESITIAAHDVLKFKSKVRY
jgi:DNA-binding protein HU-beta